MIEFQGNGVNLELGIKKYRLEKGKKFPFPLF
jgi:hypothetical protein